MAELLDEAVRTVEQLRELTQEAHGLLKDAKRITKELKEAIKESETVVPDLVKEQVSELIDQEVAKGLGLYKSELRSAIDDACKHIGKEFDEFANILKHGDRKGHGQHIMDQVFPGWEEIVSKNDSEDGS